MWPDWLAAFGTPFQGITAVGIITLIGYLLVHRRGMRKLDIEAEQVEINAEAIRKEERKDIRDHYAQEVNRYALQVVGLRDELQKCEEECARRIDGIEKEHERRFDKVEKRNNFLERKLRESEASRISEQLSLIRTVMDAVPDARFQTLIRALEKQQQQLPHLAPPEERGIEPLKE